MIPTGSYTQKCIAHIELRNHLIDNYFSCLLHTQATSTNSEHGIHSYRFCVMHVAIRTSPLAGLRGFLPARIASFTPIDRTTARCRAAMSTFMKIPRIVQSCPAQDLVARHELIPHRCQGLVTVVGRLVDVDSSPLELVELDVTSTDP